MTGTPSKDRAEAYAERASELASIQCGASCPCFDGPCHCRDSIAAALAASFAEGMKRAAEIAQEPFITGNQHAIEACVDFMEAWEMGADDAIDGIVKCILSEAEEH